MYVLTDDNPPATSELRANGAYAACLLEIVLPGAENGDDPAQKANGKAKDTSDDREVALRVLCAGIMKNIEPIPPPSIAATVDVDRDVVLPTLEPVLSSVNLSEAEKEAQQLIERVKVEEVSAGSRTDSAGGADELQEEVPDIRKLSIKNSPKVDHRGQAEIELERLERKLRTIQQSLEILTGVCAMLPEPEPVPETEGDGEDAEEGDEGESVRDSFACPCSTKVRRRRNGRRRRRYDGGLYRTHTISCITSHPVPGGTSSRPHRPHATIFPLAHWRTLAAPADHLGSQRNSHMRARVPE